jgi:hypothetical protein
MYLYMSQQMKIENQQKDSKQQEKQAPLKSSHSARSVMKKQLKTMNYDEGEKFLKPAEKNKGEVQNRKIQLQTTDQPGKDPLKDMANQIRSIHPAGFPVAIYQEGEKEFANQAVNWASRENAVGFSGKSASKANLKIGRAMKASESTAPGDLINSIGTAVRNLLEKYPDTTTTAANAGRINSVAIFTHSTTGWMGVGSDIETEGAAGFIKAIKSAVSSDVKIAIYGCSTGRGADEEQSWYKGTMQGGGKGSIGEAMRDALAGEGMKGSEVWTHTTVGHTTNNYALRVFKGKKGETGEAFFNWVFSDDFVSKEIDYFKSMVTSNGYINVSEKWKNDPVKNILRSSMFNAYSDANASLKCRGDNLAEMAPQYKDEVITLIRNYWTNTHKPKKEKSIVTSIVAKLKLKK